MGAPAALGEHSLGGQAIVAIGAQADFQIGGSLSRKCQGWRMIEAICDAIESRYAGAEASAVALRALSNGLVLVKAPPRLTEPFVVYEVSQDGEFVHELAPRISYGMFNVRFFSVSADEERSEVSSIHSAVMALFDNATMSMTGNVCLSMLRTSEVVTTRDGQWCFIATYRVAVQPS
jgi:hypothetical protein